MVISMKPVGFFQGIPSVQTLVQNPNKNETKCFHADDLQSENVIVSFSKGKDCVHIISEHTTMIFKW